MERISISDLRARFSELVARAEAGERFEIMRHGKPVALMVPAVSVEPPTEAL